MSPVAAAASLALLLLAAGPGLWRLFARARDDRRYRAGAPDRARAREEMLAALRVQSRLLERSGVGIAHIAQRRVRWANPRWGEIFGVRPEQLLGSSMLPFYLDQAAYETFGRTAYEQLDRDGRFAGEIHLRRVDGSLFWAFLVGSRLDPGQPEAGAIWCLEDISARVEAQQELDDALKLNQKLIATSPTGIILFRAVEGDCIQVNEAAARILGGRREAVLERNFRRIPSWDGTVIPAVVEAALATGLEQHVETALNTLYGREATLAHTFVTFESRGERLLLLMLADVTERVQAAAALRESEERYRVVVEALNEGLAIVAPDQVFSYCNDRLCEMLGYAREEILGQPRGFLVAEPDRDWLEQRRAGRPSGAADSYELRLRRKDGQFLDAMLSVAPTEDARGAPVPSPVLVTDISVRRRAEREREHLMAELEQKNKELETLVYVASHDLRSPLVNIQGFSRRLGKSLAELDRQVATCASLAELRGAVQPLLEERMPAALEYIQASGVKMDAIINGLLQLSRAGRMVLRREPLDMNQLLAATAAAQAYQLQEADGALEVEPLPPCQADPVQVAQVFSNLLDNAIKYRRGDRPLRIRVSARTRGACAAYCLEDNGIGIPVEHRGRIFDIFQRLDPLGPTKGEGMGLTLVRRMVERNGGRVWVEAPAGGGCQFFVELPTV